MRKLLSAAMLALVCISITAQAAEPIQNFMELRDGRHIITKVFEAAPESDPSMFKEEPFEQDGYSYAYYETAVEEIRTIERRQASRTAEAVTETSDVQSILSGFVPDMEYQDEDGYSGKLTLNHTSLVTEVKEYVTKTYTLKDTIMIMGLGSNDLSNIPKSIIKSGVTLTLQNVDWSAQETATLDYETVITKYQALAYYSGSYTKKEAASYESTVKYTGELTKTRLDKVVYTLTYIGTELPEPKPIAEPEPIPEPEFQNENSRCLHLAIAGMALCLVLITGAVMFCALYYNAFAYLKNGDEIKLIARKRIKWSNPVIDLSGLKLTGKEVAVQVKKKVAVRLFGRHINTIAADSFAVRCLVDNQDSDFWYVISIPATPDKKEEKLGG